ncbi:hypothetical protein A1O1_02032 [Capronia coronata CBS 617.96]|uniref:nitrilase n=1 Tax=Capronia coronata CBS 617.96 TaxID=1182541 RepID=W9YVC3_9EURO|nr:uncharacterized protein A1O1_02032 [Capronia coronata CBS 617.96]EXJ93640.1 hypothetical protein A1O1_02032 [Capronia coronata CBS 617.96]
MSASTPKKTVKIAAVQAEPAWNDLQGGVNKVVSIVQEAAKNGTEILGFPEVFIPGYPWAMWSQPVSGNALYMDEYYHNSLVKESPEMDRIREAVREAGIFVVLGYSERDKGSLYMAQSFIDPTGTIVHHRRKIKPTHVERAYWGDGQTESLTTTVQSPYARVSALNCWEHSQPLLRYYTYWQNPDIHVACWPLIWDMPEDGSPWQWHITPEASQRFSQVLAMEGACFVMMATQLMTEKNRKKCLVENYPYARTPGGGFAMIYGPDGTELVKPLDPGEEGILYAEVDLNKRALAKHNLDPVGHYSRPDLLSLRVTKHSAKHPGTQVHFLE